MIDKKKVVELVKVKGPVLPVHISKDVGTNILMTSAILSELVSNKEIRITNTKIGGSPLYYFPGQEYKLQSLYNHLNEKDKRAYDLLKNRKILRDTSLAPIERVSLREIKDFAKQLNVSARNGKEIFWKWFLLSSEDATRIIKSALNSDVKKEVHAKVQKQEPINLPVQQPSQNVQTSQPISTHMPSQQKVQTQANTSLHSIQSPNTEVKREEPKININPKPNVEKEDQSSHETKQENKTEKISENLDQRQNSIKDHQKTEDKPIKKEPAEKTKPEENSEEKLQNKKELSDKDKTISDKFLSKIKSFLTRKEVKLIDSEVVRKESEIDLIIEIPSAVGTLKYYCKARNKKRINDSDLSSAYVKGESNKLPVLFLTEGVLTKKAQEMLHKEFKNISFKKI